MNLHVLTSENEYFGIDGDNPVVFNAGILPRAENENLTTLTSQ
jgi:hypothetical protein